jgi:hypothetical protein
MSAPDRATPTGTDPGAPPTGGEKDRKAAIMIVSGGFLIFLALVYIAIAVFSHRP